MDKQTPTNPLLETNHFLLKGVSLNDTEALFTFMSDKETMQYITPHPVTNLDEMRDKIKGHLENFQKEKEIPWVIVNKEIDEVIGFFRLHKLNLWHKKAELGAIIRNDFQQKGVMTEILPPILSFGFNQLGLNRIVGDIFAGNQGSRKLLEKFGFKKEGVLRQTDFDGKDYHDTVVYSMLKAEYEER